MADTIMMVRYLHVITILLDPRGALVWKMTRLDA
jgi:hypothetical protein